MINSLKRLSLQSFIYGFGSVVNKLLGFVLLPIYTRYLTPADYGILSLLTITEGILIYIAQFGIGSSLFREIIYKDSDESTTVSTSLFFLLGASLVVFGAGVIFAEFISIALFALPDYTLHLRLVFSTGFMDLFKLMIMSYLRIHEQSRIFSAISIGSFIIGAGLNILFIVVLKQGLVGLLIAQLAVATLLALLSVVYLLRAVKPIFSSVILGNMLSYGIPLVPANISSLVLTSADRYILNSFSSSSEVGLYSLGYNLGMVVNIVVQAVQLAWPAQMFEIAKRPDAEQQFSKIFTYYWAGIGFLALGLSVLSREALEIMTTPAFYRASVVVPLVALSYLMYGARFMTTIGLFVQNKTIISSLIIVVTAGFNLVLSFLLIPRFGMLGAAWATFISYFVLMLINLLANLKTWNIHYEYARIVKLSVSWALVFAVSILVKSENIWINLGIKSLLLLVYPFLLFLFRFFTKSELDYGKSIYAKIMLKFPARKANHSPTD